MKKIGLVLVLVLLMTIFAITFTACNLFSKSSQTGQTNGNNNTCNHNYGEWITTQSATCTEKGSRQKVCSLCGNVVRKDIDALGHSEVIDRAVSPTCTDTGLTEGKHCGRCEEVLLAQQIINALGHQYVDGVCSRCHSVDPNYHPVDPEEEARLERVALENDIETSLKQKLNEKFGEELVVNIDVKYFSIEQDSMTFQTTFHTNGVIKFVDDETIHTFSLGKILTSEEFNILTYFYYIDIDEAKDLSINYDNDDLTLAKTFILEQTVDDFSAQLDDRNWDLKMLTSSQIEKQLEINLEIESNLYFIRRFNCSYSINLDLKYVSLEHNLIYGYLLCLNGKTGNIFGDVIEDINMQFLISQVDYDYLNDTVLTTPVNETNDLKDNYTAEQLNQVVDIINSDTSYAKFCIINNMQYDVENDWDNSYEFQISNEGFVTYNDGNDIVLFGYLGHELNVVIPSNITKICSAFAGHTDLTSITISESVTSIEDYAFYNCGSLTSITIPNSVTSIGSSVFEKCSSLQYNVYNNANYLGNSINPHLALLKAASTDITNCVINENCKFIYEHAFAMCTSLASITIPDSVTSIGYRAFRNCIELTSITIPNSVTSIGYEAFYNCSGLTSITIPNSVTSIGSYAFSGCSTLKSISYSGTTVQWEAVLKGNMWYPPTNFTVYHTD